MACRTPSGEPAIFLAARDIVTATDGAEGRRTEAESDEFTAGLTVLERLREERRNSSRFFDDVRRSVQSVVTRKSRRAKRGRAEPKL